MYGLYRNTVYAFLFFCSGGCKTEVRFIVSSRLTTFFDCYPFGCGLSIWFRKTKSCNSPPPNANFSAKSLKICVVEPNKCKRKDSDIVSISESLGVEWLKKWYNSRLSFCNTAFVLHWVHLGAKIGSWVQKRLGGCNTELSFCYLLFRRNSHIPLLYTIIVLLCFSLLMGITCCLLVHKYSFA